MERGVVGKIIVDSTDAPAAGKKAPAIPDDDDDD